MRKAGLIVGTLSILCLAQPAFAFGAIAVQGTNGNVGWSHDYGSKGEAREAALQQCGPGCKAVLDFWNGCGAYAADQDGGSTVWGTGIADNASQAQDTAVSNCESYGGNSCKVRAWGCE
jgi:Domain of unknown function (DUF4189)